MSTLLCPCVALPANLFLRRGVLRAAAVVQVARAAYLARVPGASAAVGPVAVLPRGRVLAYTAVQVSVYPQWRGAGLGRAVSGGADAVGVSGCSAVAWRRARVWV